MSVEKVYKCDLCGEYAQRGGLSRLGVRTLDDRPEDAENVDVCARCGDRPVGEVLAAAAGMRQEVTAGG